MLNYLWTCITCGLYVESCTILVVCWIIRGPAWYSTDYRVYRGSSMMVRSLRWLLLYLCSYKLVGSTTAWHGFNPLGDIVNYHQDVFTVLWLWKRSHVVNTLDIEELHLEVVGEWNGISWIDIHVPLTCSTSTDEVLCILIHGWPKESTLLDLWMSAECT